jgi:hypothetical protein
LGLMSCWISSMRSDMLALRQLSGARAVGALGLSTRRDTSPAVNRKRQYDSEADYWNEVC